MTNLQDMSKAELTAFLTEKFNIKTFVASQIFEWLNKGAKFHQMTNISKDLRQNLANHCIDQCVEIEKTFVSEIDGTKKFLFRLSDGNLIEGVLMSYKHGNTVCVSTQVGCRMGCKFCASTIGGLVRNLTAGEILGQVILANSIGENQRNVTNVVLMGSGEPLDNFDNVLKFLALLTSPDGLNFSQRNISLSTCGLVPEIKALADSGLGINLTISLHNASQQSRAEIMPIANKYSVNEVINAAQYYFEKTGRRIIFEYTLIKGQNDSYSDALKLSSLMKNMSCHINLIRLNPVEKQNQTPLKATTEADAKKFLQYLEKLNLSATLRRQMGLDIAGACGQLRNLYVGQKAPVSSDKKP